MLRLLLRFRLRVDRLGSHDRVNGPDLLAHFSAAVRVTDRLIRFTAGS